MPWTIDEAEPGPLADRLRGEKRLEDPLPCFQAHPPAAVADRQQNMGAGARLGVNPRVVLVELHASCFDPQPAAARHGIARIHHQIHDDLFHLMGIGTHRAAFRGERDYAVPRLLPPVGGAWDAFSRSPD